MKSLVAIITLLVLVLLSIHCDAFLWKKADSPTPPPRPPSTATPRPPPGPRPPPVGSSGSGSGSSNCPPPAPPKSKPRPLPCSIATESERILSRDCMLEGQGCDQHVWLQDKNEETAFVFSFCDLGDSTFDYGRELNGLIYGNCHTNRSPCKDGFQCTEALTVHRRDSGPFKISFCLPSDSNPTWEDFRFRGDTNMNRPQWEMPEKPEGGQEENWDEGDEMDPNEGGERQRINLGR